MRPTQSCSSGIWPPEATSPTNQQTIAQTRKIAPNPRPWVRQRANSRGKEGPRPPEVRRYRRRAPIKAMQAQSFTCLMAAIASGVKPPPGENLLLLRPVIVMATNARIMGRHRQTCRWAIDSLLLKYENDRLPG